VRRRWAARVRVGSLAVIRHPEVAAKRPSKGDGIQVGYCRLGH
jgi:hypothetical protein